MEHLGRYERGAIQDFLYPCVLPTAEKVVEWKQTYLDGWDGYIDDLDPDPDPDYKTTRQQVLVDTFDLVRRLARWQEAS